MNAVRRVRTQAELPAGRFSLAVADMRFRQLQRGGNALSGGSDQFLEDRHAQRRCSDRLDRPAGLGNVAERGDAVPQAFAQAERTRPLPEAVSPRLLAFTRR